MEFNLRPWAISDLDSLLKYANNINISSRMTDAFPHPYLEQNGRDFITFANRDNPVHIFAIDINGEACGGIGVHPQADVHRNNAELGYWLAQPFWGNGIITRAIPKVVQFAFDTYPITRVFARPYGSNLASQRVLEKTGFILEARIEKNIIKNGQLEDELIYGFRRA